MIFEKIPTVPTSKELLDKAFRRSVRARSGKIIKNDEDLKRAHESMIITSANILSDNLTNIVRQFPSFDDLSPFYYKLVNILSGVDKLKMALSSVDWAGNKIHEISRESVGKIRANKDPLTIRKETFGRLSSIINSIEKDLLFLNVARNKFRKLPSISEDPTIIIAGYPNVGKSSFVSQITTAHPKIAQYPFTTKGVIIGHFFVGNTRHQVIDTPGLLDRPMEDRNDIELQAITALECLDAVVLFIIDPSETCGYEMKDQENMYKDIKKQFGLPILRVSNKSDIFKNESDVFDFKMSTKTGEGIETVIMRLIEMIREKPKLIKIDGINATHEEISHKIGDSNTWN